MRKLQRSLMMVVAMLLVPSLTCHAAEEISLQLKWKHAFQFAGFYIAKEKGFYADEGLNVTLIEGSPGKDPIQHAVSGPGHFAITDTGVILARVNNQPVKALAAIFQHSPLALAVKESSGIKSFEDLHGKRAMMQAGHMDAVILAAIKKAGLTNRTFNRQDSSFNIQDLIDGNTDAFSVYVTDQPHQLKEMGIPYRILHPVEYGIDFYGDILITSEDEIKKYPHRTAAFIQASLKGWSYALEHIDETIELIQSKYNSQNLSPGQLYFEAEETSEMVLKDVVQIGYMSQTRWQKIIDTYVELGLISKPLSASELIYSRDPTFTDFLKQYQWQLIVGSLLALLIIFGLQSSLLRRMVHNRTEKLEESESRFRTLVGNIPGIVFRCHPGDLCNMEFISDDVEKITGFPATDFINNSVRSYRTITHPEDREKVAACIRDALQHEAPYRLEYRIICADATERWVEESGQSGHSKSNTQPWIDGCIFDISARKRSEHLERSTNQILGMVASNQELTKTFAEIIAIYEQRYAGMRASILLISDNRLRAGSVASLPDAYNAAIEGLEIGPSVGSCGTAAFLKKRVIVEDIEHDPLWSDYADFALSFNLRACWSEPIFSSDGKVLGTFAMYYDHPRRPDSEEISDISNAAHLTAIAIERDHFIQSLRKLSQAIEQTAEVVTITNQNGIIEYVNPAFSNITGFSAEEAIGKTPQLFRDASYAHLSEEIRRVISLGDTWQGKVMEMKKDGSSYPAMLTISPIRSEAGDITHHVAVHEDLSKLQEMEEKFYQAQKMEAIGTLVGGIAHDFNNMLAGITGNTYLAKRIAKDQPEIIDKLNNTENLIGRASEIIKQLLTFAKKDVVQKRTILLTPFLKETFNLYKVTIPEDVELTLDIEQEMKVSADITQLHQVLLNLMTNARDAVTDVEQPAIQIRLNQFDPDPAFLARHELAHPQRYAHLSIEDNGHGIPDEFMHTIFEPFFTTKAVGKGTGLGLSMVFGAVQSHDGLIDVESHPDHGTTFHIYLPIITASVEEEPAIMPQIGSIKGKTILFVDDESHILNIISEVLEELGYRVLTAENGQQALQLFKEQHEKIDLLLTDIVMPKMGGFELAEKVRKINAAIPVIFATGYEKNMAMEAKRRINSAVTLNKPYSVELLAQTVNQLLTSKSST